MADQINENESIELTEDEEVGVQLPFLVLFPSMFSVIVAGTIPVFLLSWFIFQLLAPLFQSWLSLIFWTLLLPIIFWMLYFVYLLVTVLVTKIFLAYYDYKCPPTEDYIERQFKDKTHPDFKKLHYYHIRGAIIKYAIWISQKCPFPSIVKRILIFFGHNRIGKSVIYDNCFPGLEFTKIDDEAIVEVGSALSTHVVESLYGKLLTGRIVMEEGSIVGMSNIVGPNSIFQEEFHTGENALVFVKWQLEMKEGNPSKFFNGRPAFLSDIEHLFADKDLLERHQKLVQGL